LDTFPYGAHTTASEALWMGLPLVTLRGSTFASSVGASLLTALRLPNLIADNESQYIAKVCELIDKPDKLVSAKDKLSFERSSSALFSGVRFARDFERALSLAHSRFAGGLEAKTFQV